jgi:hypothetical protein
MCPSVSGRSAIMPLASRRDARRIGVPVHDRVRPLPEQVDVVARGVQVPRADAGGRQPISENLRPLGPKNHSMCVADVPIPSAVITRRPISRSSA